MVASAGREAAKGGRRNGVCSFLRCFSGPSVWSEPHGVDEAFAWDAGAVAGALDRGAGWALEQAENELIGAEQQRAKVGDAVVA